MTSKKINARQLKKAKLQDVSGKLNGTVLLGEVVAWNARSETKRTFQDVVDALKRAKLDHEVAKEFMPRFAFSRACKELTDQAVIDVVKENDTTIKFQFTKKSMKGEDWEFAKDCNLELDKKTGQVTCKKKELQTKAQELLDAAIIERNTSDITRIVQALFEQQTDLLPVRDQGGAYLVLIEHIDIANKIGQFLKDVGGKLRRFPIPAGTHTGDEAVQDTIASAIMGLIKDHEQAVDQFTVNTRGDTMTNAANKIKATRNKIEGYAVHLKDKADLLMKEIDKANKKLKQKIDTITVEKENMPPEPERLFGQTTTKLLKWMGANGWKWEEAKRVMEGYGFRIQDSTYRGQVWCGKTGQYGEPAELDDKQIAELEKKRKVKVKA